MNEIYEKIMIPIKDKNLYICCESFCKKQAWMEGAIESCYDVIKLMKFKNIKVKIKKEKKLKKYNIDEVLKHKDWIVMEVGNERRVYDLSKWISEHPGGDKIYNVPNPFDFMELISIEGKTNFFERRVGEYALATKDAIRDDAFEFDEEF